MASVTFGTPAATINLPGTIEADTGGTIQAVVSLVLVSSGEVLNVGTITNAGTFDLSAMVPTGTYATQCALTETILINGPTVVV